MEKVIVQTNSAPATKSSPRVNGNITAPRVFLIDESGEKIGDVAIAEAMRLAEARDLDLLEINPVGNPPVCKILDFGKYKYESQKRASEARKKAKVVETKELKFRPVTDTHDYQVKLRAAAKFLKQGHKVKLTMRFRGRELSHQELGLALLTRGRDDLAAYSKVEQPPRMDGRQMSLVLVSTCS
ncbi:translation initiation factor IF-3 [Thalassospira xianhensis]|uniref:Translation initiation factor IF-3 n=2 Tax=Thalassospira TaxID=168934 RepID=A0A285THV6_9PROT|nr:MULTISPECIES: translation initiation factor IF-3 [Thalassospira]RCK07552.1 translation initiation factor IF-3 [Thalassospira xianhensis MCCC 1A02616]SOC21547.1 bacterial translation initiation factor 3 (bIF-3) [Thalassospira xiamenensis]